MFEDVEKIALHFRTLYDKRVKRVHSADLKLTHKHNFKL